MSTKDAAELLGVERPRIWRLEQRGRLTRVATTRATPLFLRCEVEALRVELEAERDAVRQRADERARAAA